jgi:hypothetical protein
MSTSRFIVVLIFFSVHLLTLPMLTLSLASGSRMCSRSFRIVIKFSGVCYEWFVAVRYKFNLVTYDQRPLPVERRGGTERNLNEITAGSR